AGAADERRLAGAELAGHVDDVARTEPSREPRRERLRLLRARGDDPHRRPARGPPQPAREQTTRARPAARSAPAPSARGYAGSPPRAPPACAACTARPPDGRSGRAVRACPPASPPAPDRAHA